MWRFLKVITVEPILFCYMLIIFMESNALQELIYTKLCLENNKTECNNTHNEQQDGSLKETTTFWLKYNNVCLSSFTFIVSFYVASWSDQLGRKIIMLIPPLGTIIAAVINCILSIYIHIHVAFFLLSAAISGATFGSVGIIAATFGFIADITNENNRTQRIVVLEAMLFIGGTFGIFIAGLFLKEKNIDNILNNFAQLFLFEIIIAIFITFYIIIFIPKNATINYNSNLVKSCRNLFSFEHVKESLRTVFKTRSERKRKKILLLLGALICIYFGFTGIIFMLSKLI